VVGSDVGGIQPLFAVCYFVVGWLVKEIIYLIGSDSTMLSSRVA
jgi:hypothetical protein